MARALPIYAEQEALTFRCSSCAACCRGLRVTLTHHDLERLLRTQSGGAAELVEWLAPHEVDMTGEPSSFVELREGRRLMVLAQRDGACRLLNADNSCSVYTARPADCRAFPFEVEERRAPEAAAIRLADFSGCEYESDGANASSMILANDTQRWSELASYQGRVARWNRWARHRRRLGRLPGSAAEYLQYLQTP